MPTPAPARRHAVSSCRQRGTSVRRVSTSDSVARARDSEGFGNRGTAATATRRRNDRRRGKIYRISTEPFRIGVHELGWLTPRPARDLHEPDRHEQARVKPDSNARLRAYCPQGRWGSSPPADIGAQIGRSVRVTRRTRCSLRERERPLRHIGEAGWPSSACAIGTPVDRSAAVGRGRWCLGDDLADV
jgi:hypothetical protein